MRTSFWVYPWDLVDEGIGVALDRMVERAGTSRIFVAALYHSGKFLQVHNPKRRVTFPRPGTLYFEPRFAHAGRIQAPVWTGAVDFWDELRVEADARQLEVTAWVLGLHNSGIGFGYPDCAVENAFGDTIHTDLCANSKDVQDFLCAAAHDVSSLPVDSLLFESLEYMPFRHGYHHEVIGIPTGPTVDFLMSLCFCGNCEVSANDEGVDFDAVRDWVRSTLQKHFADPYGKPLTLDWTGIRLAAGGRLASYLDMRSGAITKLVTRIAGVVRSTSAIRLGVVDFGPLYGLGPDGRRWENGMDLAAVLPLIDEIHPTFYFTEGGMHRKKVDEYRRLLDGEGQMIPALRAILPQTPSEASLQAQVQVLRGVTEVSFYNYGLMPLPTLEWIQRAMLSSFDAFSSVVPKVR